MKFPRLSSVTEAAEIFVHGLCRVIDLSIRLLTCLLTEPFQTTRTGIYGILFSVSRDANKFLFCSLCNVVWAGQNS